MSKNLLVNVFSAESWDGKVFLSFTHFSGDDILGSSDMKLTIEDANNLIDSLVGAVNDIQARQAEKINA
jgi:hypothetical protein